MQEGTQRTKRGYAFACRPCKDRKIKCSGPISETNTRCLACDKAERNCYDGPSESSAKRHRQAARQSDGQIFAHSASPDRIHRRSSVIEGAIQEFPDQQRADFDVAGNYRTGSISSGHPQSSDVQGNADIGSFHNASDLREAESMALEALDAVSMDPTGRPAVFGTTSHLHEPVSVTLPSPQNPQHDTTTQNHHILHENAKLQRMWESIVYQNLKNEEVEAGLKQDLLQTYWCWQHPTHLAVYRSLFVRDMALSGPYFSTFLLNVIYAHACRYTATLSPVNKAEVFLQKARLLLMEEIEMPTSIPTIQGLIILGGRECAVGKASQGWLYTGMALRMMKDLGIHLEAENSNFVQNLPVEEQEARRRLFYSAYTWDKSISLALGRGPTFHETGGRLPPPIMDDSDDDVTWTPYYADGCTPSTAIGYPERKSYIASTFRQFCTLAEIINMILVQLYVAGPQRALSHATLANLDSRITLWWTNVPTDLKLEKPLEERWAPPPHILNVNLLKEAARILLHRPFTAARSTQISRVAAAACTESGKRIHELLLLHKGTFGFSNLIYLARYCIYVAATVAATDVKYARTEEAISDAAARLSLGLRALEAGAPQSPAFTKSLQILRKQLRNPEPQHRHPTLRLGKDLPLLASGKALQNRADIHANASQPMPASLINDYLLDGEGARQGQELGLPPMGQLQLPELGTYDADQSHSFQIDNPGIREEAQKSQNEHNVGSPSELFNFDFSAFPIFPEQGSDWAALLGGLSIPFPFLEDDASTSRATAGNAHNTQVNVGQSGIPPMTFGWDWQNAGNEMPSQ